MPRVSLSWLELAVWEEEEGERMPRDPDLQTRRVPLSLFPVCVNFGTVGQAGALTPTKIEIAGLL